MRALQALPDAGINAFVELTLETPDLQRAAAFYEQVVGLRALSRARDRVWLAVGESARLGLWSPGRKEFGDEGGRHVHFAFSVPRGGLKDLERRLRTAGVEVTGPVEHDGGDRSLYFFDPAGNRVEAWDFLTHGSGAERGVDALS
jgi:catechol-2,3-dioxygenase